MQPALVHTTPTGQQLRWDGLQRTPRGEGDMKPGGRLLAGSPASRACVGSPRQTDREDCTKAPAARAAKCDSRGRPSAWWSATLETCPGRVVCRSCFRPARPNLVSARHGLSNAAGWLRGRCRPVRSTRRAGRSCGRRQEASRSVPGRACRRCRSRGRRRRRRMPWRSGRGASQRVAPRRHAPVGTGSPFRVVWLRPQHRHTEGQRGDVQGGTSRWRRSWPRPDVPLPAQPESRCPGAGDPPEVPNEDHWPPAEK